jgi:hypothetical protein
MGFRVKTGSQGDVVGDVVGVVGVVGVGGVVEDMVGMEVEKTWY